MNIGNIMNEMKQNTGTIKGVLLLHGKEIQVETTCIAFTNNGQKHVTFILKE